MGQLPLPSKLPRQTELSQWQLLSFLAGICGRGGESENVDVDVEEIEDVGDVCACKNVSSEGAPIEERKAWRDAVSVFRRNKRRRLRVLERFVLDEALALLPWKDIKQMRCVWPSLLCHSAAGQFIYHHPLLQRRAHVP